MTVNATLTERRILQLKHRPLKPVEFISTLAKFEPIYREEEDAILQWWNIFPLLQNLPLNNSYFQMGNINKYYVTKYHTGINQDNLGNFLHYSDIIWGGERKPFKWP